MKCLNCKGNLNHGCFLWARFSDTETYHMKKDLVLPKQLRWFAFCSEECQSTFFMDKRWFSKLTTPFHSRLKSFQETLNELQQACISTDNEDTKDLLYVLVKTIHDSKG